MLLIEARRKLNAHFYGRMSPVLAMEWLFQHESDPDIDEPLVLGARGGRTQRRRKEFEPNPRVRNSMCKNYDEIMIRVIY